MRLVAYIALTTSVIWALIQFWGPTGLPFWPLFTGAAVLLVFTGGLVGRRAWVAPMIVCIGYAAMRGVVQLPDIVQEHAAYMVWFLVFLALVLRVGAYIPGAAYLLSGSTYPVMLIFGFPMEYLGLAPIIAEWFAVFALISIGGGQYDRRPSAHGHSADDSSGDTLLARLALGMARA